MAKADRLTLSSAYRKWAPAADLGLPEGVDVPAFTEVWLVLNANAKSSTAQPKAPAEEKGKGKGRRNRRDRRDDRVQRDDQELNIEVGMKDLEGLYKDKKKG